MCSLPKHGIALCVSATAHQPPLFRRTTRGMLTRRFALVKPGMGRTLMAAAANNHSSIVPAKNYSTVKEYQKGPKLPVPDAANTLRHFLEFAKPLQSNAEFEETKQKVVNFSQSELPKLQKLLQERGTKLNNWLTPWWLDIAYLAARTPLPVVTSPGVMFPHFPYSGIEGQVEYASKITLAALNFYHHIMSNHLPQDMAGKVPFDMSQYKFLFGTTRVPRRGVDEIVYGCQQENRPRHIVAIRRGHVFRVPVLDKLGNPLSLEQLNAQFEKVLSQSEEKNTDAIGIVSSDNRDVWAETYESLKRNPRNAANLTAIEDALFVVCLDEPTTPPRGYTEKDEQGLQCLHGSGTKNNSLNRWFDKTIQFVISPNGYAGMTYEHTPAEGPPVASLMDFVCDQIESKDALTVNPVASVDAVERLDFELGDDHKKSIAESSRKMNEVAENVELVAYSYKRYGKNFPKSVKISPDSFIQMAFQLAFYRIHRTLPPTYETATLRKFDEGRTENIRSPNTLAENFVKKMSQGTVPMADLYDALKAATETHKKYTVACMNGAGMDRHLLAWKLIAAENNLPIPSILQTPVYKRLGHFQVSTSQVPTKHFIQMCFGPSAEDCYGICYNPQEKELHFTITTFKNMGYSSKKFARELEKALHDMSSVCTKALKEQAKL